MDSWAEDFAGHPAFDALNEIEVAVGQARRMADDAGGKDLEDVIRLEHLVRLIAAEKERADPLATPPSRLTSIQQNLSKGIQEVQSYISNQNLPHLNAANTHVDNALGQALLLPKIADDRDVESLHEAVVSFRRSLGQHIGHVEREAASARRELESAQGSLEELKDSIQAEKARLDDALRRFETQFAEAEAERRKESQAALVNLQSQTSEIEERFQASQEMRTERFATALATQAEQAEAEVSSISEARAKLEEEYDGRVQGHLAALAEKKQAAEKIVGAIAQTGMVGGYQKIANAEQTAKRLWQGITVLSLIAFVVVMIMVVPGTAGGEFEWPQFIARTLAALGLGGLAAYAGREGSKHAERERHNRRLELEIASVGPFLAELDKAERDGIMKEVADRTFGRGTTPLSADDAPATTSGILEVLRLAITELGKKTG